MKVTMGENQGIEQVLGKLVELLTEKKNETASSGKQIVPHTETIQRLELMPNDVKLEGIRNYLPWSRRALRLLKAKGLEGFVSGKSVEPQDKSSAEWSIWDATNSLVAAWLLSSMSPTIATSVDTIASATEIWQSIAKMYSGAGNVMLWAETEDTISDLKQGELSLMDYVAELKRLWADVDQYDPIELPHSECVAWVRKWIEKRRVLQFLRGLNSEFEGRRASMFHQSALPSLEEAIAAMAQEELRLKMMRGAASPPSRPIFAATRIKETMQCYNCGKEGHLIRDCPQPLKPNRGRGRGGARGALRGVRGRGGRSGYTANAATIGEQSCKVAGIATAELEEQKQLKGKTHSMEDEDAEAPSGGFINFAYIDEGNYAHASISPQISRLNWILDSGASRHVTGTSSEFMSYTLYPPTHNETIQTADGTPQPIKGVGTVQCTPSILLSSVLHVPAFPVNLVSLSALVDQLDCRVILDRENCMIQERQTGRRLGSATRRSGLWYMDREETSDVLCTVLGATGGDKKSMVMLLIKYAKSFLM